ncbi:M23 family metallopeptidase [Nonomuraea rhodomycinica]|uniref:M23 family metallopeptidase n=1 Tax=Nonomuraea rhodomycinica TaxID=1712872 RepID=A0A7Y6MAX3_9ACTN|nr:M23 family metallopeptidase [Nonomuraea rhodomycinica]NUW40295.1 M23 family metallopeptidase [Nonomuraea rhodomycinica]
MRSGLLGRWAAVAGALLLTGACAQSTGVAGVSAQSPETVPPAATGPTPVVTGTIPGPDATTEASVQAPKGKSPVNVPPPRLSDFTYAFPVTGCQVSYQRQLLVLPKTTIWAGKGCTFVSPANGVVDEVSTSDRWSAATDRGQDREGRFVTVVGDDGVRYLGGHLDSVAAGIRPGVRVTAGQALGRVGASGNARTQGSNLYFAISWKTGSSAWWVRRGMVNPWRYLDAWLSGNRTLSPREETMATRARLGETPRCQVQCASKKPVKKKREPRETPDPVITITVNPT